MKEFKLSEPIYAKGADGNYYRYTVSYTPQDNVKLTKTIPHYFFWKKEIPDAVAKQELDTLVYTIALSHIVQHGENFEKALINRKGAKFDDESVVQPHDFSIVQEPFLTKVKGSSPSFDPIKTVKQQAKGFDAHDLKVSYLFDRFAGNKIRSDSLKQNIEEEESDSVLRSENGGDIPVSDDDNNIPSEDYGEPLLRHSGHQIELIENNDEVMSSDVLILPSAEEERNEKLSDTLNGQLNGTITTEQVQAISDQYQSL